MFKKIWFFFFLLMMSCAHSQDFQTPIDLSLTGIGQNALNPQIAFDPSSAGKAIAVWQRFDGTDTTIQASYTTDGGASFSTPINLSYSIIGQNAANPRIAFDPSNAGKAVAIWQRFNGASTMIQASYTIDGGASFSTPLDISISGQSAQNPQIAFDWTVSGKAIVVWSRYNGSHNIIQASVTLDGGASFSTPIDISISGQNASVPQIAFDPFNSGKAVVVWYRFNGTNTIAQASSTMDGGASFSTPVDLSITGQGAFSPQIAFAAGKAIALWQRSDGTNVIIQSSFSADGGASFSTPIDLSLSGQSASNPQIAIDLFSSGRAIAIWQRPDGSKTRIQASFTTDGGASFSTPIDLSISGQNAGNPQITFDQSTAGRAVAVWLRSNGLNDIIQSSFTTDGGASFSTPVDLSIGGFSAGNPQIAVDPSAPGGAIAVWQRSNGTNIIIQASSRQGIPVIFSPVGKQFRINSLFQKDIVNEISWESLPAAVNYKVTDSNNAILFEGLGSSFFDHGKKNGAIYRYFVTWINGIGRESSPVMVTIP